MSKEEGEVAAEKTAEKKEVPTAKVVATEIKDDKPLFQVMFSLSKGEAPFLVGTKGRNISLIRKISGVTVSIKDQNVAMAASRANPDYVMTWRMVMSACYGGILRWFETPYATKKGYPEEKQQEYSKLAFSFDCKLELLRSRRGHMCLMLIPQIILDEDNSISEEKRGYWATNLQEARQALLVLMCGNSSR